jgi:hypothetical protein
MPLARPFVLDYQNVNVHLNDVSLEMMCGDVPNVIDEVMP